MIFKNAEENDAADEDEIVRKEVEKAKKESAVAKKHKSVKNPKTKVSWVGSTIERKGKREYYSRVKLNDFEVSEFVSLKSIKKYKAYTLLIIFMTDLAIKKNGNLIQRSHVCEHM